MKSTVIALAMIAAVLFFGGCMKNAGSEESRGKVPIFNAMTGDVEQVSAVKKTDAEWKKLLTPEQYEVTRKKGTEKPFTGKCETGESGGIYRCVCCGTDLFEAGTKFDSGTGWPSFWTPVSGLNATIEDDRSLGIERDEVLCSRCGAHLGHVFEDGPPPTEKRYCINAAALAFMPAPKGIKRTETATFAAGCFWGVEETFRKTEAVVYTRAGYTGGTFKDPTYEDVCSGRTAHAEAVEVFFDPSKISYPELLDVFWKMHDPTTLNRQGPDVGAQYRSAIFYHDKTQRDAAAASRDRLEKAGTYKSPIVTRILPAGKFYPAEEYHQRYHEKHGGSCSLE